MKTLVRARGAYALLVLIALTAWSALPAEAGNPLTGEIDLAARLEPADIAPGGKGTLVIEGTLLKDQEVKGKPLEGHHIYADGEDGMKYEPIAAAGVTYDVDAAKISDTQEKVDDFGDKRQVWKKKFVLRVPITLAPDAVPGTKLGMKFTYNGCTSGKLAACYPPVKGHGILVGLPGGGGGGAKAAKPQVQNPAPQQQGEVTLAVDEAKGEAVVTFAPAFQWHMYGPQASEPGVVKISVEPVAAEGVKWGKFDMPDGDHVEEPYEVRVPFERADGVTRIEIKTEWMACTSGVGGQCSPPYNDTLRAVWPSAKGAAEDQTDIRPEQAPVASKDAILFPVVEDDDVGDGEGDSSFIQRIMTENPMLGFGFIFLMGLGLAFTPCVLPIIPITVSVISGGKADIPRKRLSALLGTYVAGLSLTFATMGVVAALGGGAISGIFSMPPVQWGIAILFLVLGFGMLGIYELQPPAWLMNLQGGAHRRSGSLLGAFLFGCLGAIIASPCTGPAIAGMLIVTAKEGSVVLGFAMFLSLGLGMGAVFFAAGALNFAMRPGPWMVWVRYAFGIIMFAVAFYYLKNYGLISETVMWVAGLIIAVSAAFAIAWHLVNKEGEEEKPARVRGLKVGSLMVLSLALVWIYTKQPDDLLSWTYVDSPAHLKKLVAKSQAEGKPVVVDFWGEWCTNCKVYDVRIATTPELRQRFERITRIKVNLSGDDRVRWDLRHALGIEQALAPYMVFIDRQGRIRRNADIDGLYGAEKVSAHIDVVLEDKKPIKTSSR